MSGANASNSSSLDCANSDSSETGEDQSLYNNGVNEEDDATKESQPTGTAPNQSGSLNYFVKKNINFKRKD